MAEWADNGIPDNLTYDNNGTLAPLRSHPYVQESPDLGHFVAKALESQREIGRRVPVGKLETPEAREAWKKEHLPKLYQAGILPAPVAKWEDYGIKKPEALIDGIQWNEERGQKFAQTLHKWGIPKDAVPELMALHEEALRSGHEMFKTDYATAEAELKKEFGPDYDNRFEAAKRLYKQLGFTDAEQEMIDLTGLGNHPRFLAAFMRMAPLMQSDTSANVGGQQRGASMTPDEVRADIVRMGEDSTHPMYALYKANPTSPEIEKYLQAQYAKAYPEAVGKTVTY